MLLAEDVNGQECPVLDTFSEYDIEGPYEQMLTFINIGQQFGPEGPGNAFQEGCQYTCDFRR